MKKSQFNHLFELLENLKDEVEGVEFWSARDLQTLFGYAKWQNFELAVKKAVLSIKNTSESVDEHFAKVSKTIPMPRNIIKTICLSSK
jgi:DNA-damage-inducible protein D